MKRITLNGSLVEVDEYPNYRNVPDEMLYFHLKEEEACENYEACAHIRDEFISRGSHNMYEITGEGRGICVDI